MNFCPPPVPVERAISIYIAKDCTWQQVAQFLQQETGHFWNAATINSAVNRFRAGIARRGAGWDEERTERLKDMWPTHSAGVIALDLGLPRNAVIGKAHRLGLVGKKPPKEPGEKKTAAKTAARKQRLKFGRPRRASPLPRILPPPLYLPPEVKEYILGQGKPLLDLAPDECTWALNDCPPGGTYFFCAAKKHGDLPFCEAHAVRAYNAPAAEVLKKASERMKAGLTGKKQERA